MSPEPSVSVLGFGFRLRSNVTSDPNLTSTTVGRAAVSGMQRYPACLDSYEARGVKGCLGCCVHRLSIKEGGEGDLSAFLTSSCEPILQRQHPVAVLAGSDRIGSDRI